MENEHIANGSVNHDNDFDDDSCEDASQSYEDRDEAPPSTTKKVPCPFHS